jgi:hypothetical protein
MLILLKEVPENMLILSSPIKRKNQKRIKRTKREEEEEDADVLPSSSMTVKRTLTLLLRKPAPLIVHLVPPCTGPLAGYIENTIIDRMFYQLVDNKILVILFEC